MARTRSGAVPATRVPSRNDPAASASARSPPRPPASASASARTWPRWEIRATAASCSADVAERIRAPLSIASRATRAHVSGSAPGSAATSHVAPRNRSGSPASQPEWAVPAMGCPPTNRAPRPWRRTASRTGPLTLMTSVRATPGACSATAPRTASRAGRGTATTTRASDSRARRSVSGRSVVTAKPAAVAASAPAAERFHPKARSGPRARISEPPIRPAPSTHTSAVTVT